MVISEGRTICSDYIPNKKLEKNLGCSIERVRIGHGTVHVGLGPVCGQSVPQYSHGDGGNQRTGQEVDSLLSGRHGG